jgi:glycine betaine catabolism B
MAQELEAKVLEVIQRTYNVKSIRLAIDSPIDFKAGQFLSATLLNNPTLKRYLSISNSPTEGAYLEFTKRITGSDFSKALDQLKIGDKVKIQYPMGNFTLGQPKERLTFLSGGIGITPLRSMTKFVVDKNLGTDIVLVYANRSVKDIVFREDFDAMQKAYQRLRVVHILCEPDPSFKCLPGLINAQVIKNEITDYLERKFYLCGPPPMVEAMKKMLLEELSLAKNNIILENFQGY